MPNSVIETIRKHLRGNRIPDRMRAPPSYEKHQYLIILWPQIIELTLAHDQINTIIMGMENASLSGCHAWDNQHLRMPLYQYTFNRVHKRRKSYRSNHMLNITLPVKAFDHYSADTQQLKTGESVIFTNIDIACHHALVMRLPGDTARDSCGIPKWFNTFKFA